MSRYGDRFEGMWRRLLLAQPGEPVETLVQTNWLQGPALFVDLRQPPAIAARVQASCLAEVQPDEARIMAGQEGFAGRLVLSGDIADWQRSVDFQPLGPLGDRGRLVREGELLIEHGVEADYIEYWQLDRQPPGTPCAAAHFMSESDGRNVYLVQCGRHFAYARDRGFPLPPGTDLAAMLCDTDASQAQALVDCEISLGTVTPDGWRIERSTLPWREGACLLGPETTLERALLEVADVDARGAPLTRRLRLRDLHSTFDFAFAPLPTPPSPPAATIPVVDIAALGAGDPAAEARTIEQLRAAASGVGFLHIIGHGIAPAVIDRLQAAAKRFFDLPEKRKLASYIGHSSNHRGYVPEGEEAFLQQARDRKEAYDLALDLPAERVPANHPMLGPNRWPELPGFREDVMGYYAAVFAVGRRLLRGFAMALGQKADTLDHLVVVPPSQLRLIHYPHQPGVEDVPGIGAHTDYECFTLLLATTPGLEVMGDDGEWVGVDPVPGALVVNIGDMMEFWSGGAFIATSHRVRKVSEERYSFPLFFALDYDVELSPLGRPEQSIRTGEHLYAQTVQTFRYLKERAERGEIALPESSRPLSSFGQEARTRNAKHA